MKNVAKYATAVCFVATLWYAIVGVRVGTEPIQGGWVIKAMIAYAS
jgi:hypothetical protein